MKKILLVCNAGMSTSMLVKKMEDVARKREIAVDIKAMSFTESQQAIHEVDIICLGPQIRYLETKMKETIKGKIPLFVIDMQTYGTMNGEEVLDQALEMIED
ncbi:MAG: PTS sugar transporter subunit IIB [Breznakia sp.]